VDDSSKRNIFNELNDSRPVKSIQAFYYLVTTNLKDTLVAGQFPEGIFHIPTAYFRTKKDAVAFADKYANIYKLKITYSYAEEENKTVLFCPAVINLATDFNNNYPEIIIESASRID
jgi:hypothetical protein